MQIIAHLLSPKERKSLLRSFRNHAHCKNISLELSNNNGIAVAIKIHCRDCDEVLDITDFSTW